MHVMHAYANLHELPCMPSRFFNPHQTFLRRYQARGQLGHWHAIYWSSGLQAWGVMETKAGNLPAARSLFKTAVSLQPRNDASWEAWLRMEEQNDLMERANALRIARFEAEASNSVPKAFSTMPDAPGPVLSTVRVPSYPPATCICIVAMLFCCVEILYLSL
jgi:hypothetical protein